MKKIQLKALLIASFLGLTLALCTPLSSIRADEITISDNGAGSESSVSVSSAPQTTVVQNNESATSNEIHTQSNTGGNEANSNTGGSTEISTGDSTTSTTVGNNTNTSQVSDNCSCPQSQTNATISGNGSASQNQANITNSGQTTITVNQNSTVKNNITTTANTGGNTANFNIGDTLIQTGNIYSNNKIQNTTNLAMVDVSSQNNSSEAVNFFISGNGALSQNDIFIDQKYKNTVSIAQTSKIYNVLNFFGNTGKNSANFNNGDVFIKTGDIFQDNLITNKANISKVTLSCGCEKTPPITPPPPSQGGGPPPTSASPPLSSSPPSSGGGPPGNSGGGSSSGGPGGGPALPTTGNFTMWYSTFGSLIMLCIGVYLRRKYNSPTFIAI